MYGFITADYNTWYRTDSQVVAALTPLSPRASLVFFDCAVKRAVPLWEGTM